MKMTHPKLMWVANSVFPSEYYELSLKTSWMVAFANYIP